MKILFTFLICLLIFFHSTFIQAKEVNSLTQEIEAIEGLESIDEMVEAPKPMTKEEIDELLGEDPYLGQTSWLGGMEGE